MSVQDDKLPTKQTATKQTVGEVRTGSTGAPSMGSSDTLKLDAAGKRKAEKKEDVITNLITRGDEDGLIKLL